MVVDGGRELRASIDGVVLQAEVVEAETHSIRFNYLFEVFI